MTGEEMERAINFILQQQAQFWSGMEELKATTAQHSRSIAALSELMGRLAQAEIRLVERVDQLAQRVDQFIQRFDQSGPGVRPVG